MMLIEDLNGAAKQALDNDGSRSRGGLANKLGWQLALERAYIEYAARYESYSHDETLPERQTSEAPETGDDALQEESVSSREDKGAPVFVAFAEETLAASKLVPDLALNGVRTRSAGNNRLAGVVAANGRQIQSAQSRERLQQTSATSRQGFDSQSSPEKESMCLVKLSSGLQLSVRSGELDGEAVFRLSKEVRRMLLEKGQHLVKVLLNGEILWSSKEIPSSSGSDSATALYRINKTY